MASDLMPGKKAARTEYCRGFVDIHGQWNNGFYCPKWAGPEQKYCCGTDSHRYCCPREEAQEKLNNTQHIPLLIGLIVGCVVLFLTMTFIICYFCRCCWAYKRRKRMQHGGGSSAQNALVNGQMRYAVNYSVCPHQALYPEFMHMRPAPCYPVDDPPPYPGDVTYPLEDKQPLHNSEVFPSITEDMDDPSMQLSDGCGSDFNLNTYHCDENQPSTSHAILPNGSSIYLAGKTEYAESHDFSPCTDSETDSPTQVLYSEADSAKPSDSLVVDNYINEDRGS